MCFFVVFKTCFSYQAHRDEVTLKAVVSIFLLCNQLFFLTQSLITTTITRLLLIHVYPPSVFKHLLSPLLPSGLPLLLRPQHKCFDVFPWTQLIKRVKGRRQTKREKEIETVFRRFWLRRGYWIIRHLYKKSSGQLRATVNTNVRSRYK